MTMDESQFDDNFLQAEIKFCSRTMYFLPSFFLRVWPQTEPVTAIVLFPL